MAPARIGYFNHTQAIKNIRRAGNLLSRLLVFVLLCTSCDREVTDTNALAFDNQFKGVTIPYEWKCRDFNNPSAIQAPLDDSLQSILPDSLFFPGDLDKTWIYPLAKASLNDNVTIYWIEKAEFESLGTDSLCIASMIYILTTRKGVSISMIPGGEESDLKSMDGQIFRSGRIELYLRDLTWETEEQPTYSIREYKVLQDGKIVKTN